MTQMARHSGGAAVPDPEYSLSVDCVLGRAVGGRREWVVGVLLAFHCRFLPHPKYNCGFEY